MKDDLKIIVLTGIKHCGKTTLGKRLASYYGCLFFDTDDVIFQQTGKMPREIYSADGVEAFMKAETEACKSVLCQLESLGGDGYKMPCAVVSTGGGFCNNIEAQSVLSANGTFVFLKTNEDVASERIVKEISVGADGKLSNLPAYIATENPRTIEDVRSIFHSFYQKRTALYSAIANVTLELPKASKEENTQRLIAALS